MIRLKYKKGPKGMMKMKNTLFTIIALFLIASLVITGCAKKTMGPEAPSKEGAEGTEADKDLSELETLDKDLDMSELEGIEKDLEGLDW